MSGDLNRGVLTVMTVAITNLFQPNDLRWIVWLIFIWLVI
jgi:hypothetical protein